MSRLALVVRIVALFMVAMLLWYKLRRSVERSLASPVRWNRIRQVPGMVITTAVEHITDFLSINHLTTYFRVMGWHYSHYAVVVEHNGKLYAIEWSFYADDHGYPVERVPIKQLGNVFVHPLRRYLRHLYTNCPKYIKIMYPPTRVSLPLRRDWIEEIDRAGPFHCCMFVYQYLILSGGVADYHSILPRFVKYNPSRIYAELLRNRYRENLYRFEN